jgi:adenine-specific DNA-methyltransferase
MKLIDVQSPETKSADLVGANVEALRALYPEAFTEGQIDFEVLKQLLGGTVDERDEKYGLNWHGKRQARQIALTPSTGTLRPAPQDSVDWDTTQNLMIEGDNLEVLKLLQKSYAGKVKMIYIDPPYNTGKDFVYPDNFQDNIKNYLDLTGQSDDGGGLVSSNTESSGRFHTDWLNMIFPRLILARTLLREDGVLFISIDDAEVTTLRDTLRQIFGEENFLAMFVRRRRMSTGLRDTPISPDHEYVICVAKDSTRVKLYGFERREEDFPLSDSRGRYRSTDLTVGMTKEMRPNQWYPIRRSLESPEYLPPEGRVWRFEPSTMQGHIERLNIIWPDENPSGRMSRPRFKTRYESEDGIEKTNPVSTWIDTKLNDDDPEASGTITLTGGLNQEATKELRDLFGEQVLEYPKPSSLIEGLAAISTRADDLVIDFFAGSGTTGHAVWNLNSLGQGQRRFILVQLPEPTHRDDYANIAELTKERLRRAGNKIKSDSPLFPGDLGFRVFKLDSTNIRPWEPDRDRLSETLEQSVEHIKSGRTEQDVLYEVLLKLGLELTVPMEARAIATKTVYSVGAGALFVCLAEAIAGTEVESLALGIVEWHRELTPAVETTVVFRDSAFADDVAKTNLTAILTQHGLENVRSL